jgi:hypothetical protein
MHPALIDTAIDTMAYMSLKAPFKGKLAANIGMLERLITSA